VGRKGTNDEGQSKEGNKSDDEGTEIPKVVSRASSAAMTQDETQIRALVESWAKAVRAKDLDGAISYHTDDIVMFDVPMPLQSKGLDAYRKTWELFFHHSPGGSGSFDVTLLQITAGETVAFAHAILRVGDSSARLTMGLRKEKEQWLIAHEHHSYPIDLASE
jgi:uncharacterized protein (TIGR02246 family)